MHARSGEYVLWVNMYPSPKGGSGRGYPGVIGGATLCTPRGERLSLRLTGGLHDKHVGLNTDGEGMFLDLYHRLWLQGVTGEYRPRIALRGTWQNPNLVMDDQGSLSRAFLPDGSAYQGPPLSRPAASETVPIVLSHGSYWSFRAACAAAGR
jgi:hypothetical protein